MSVAFASVRHAERADEHGRFTLNRAGVLNVWQYDEQIFEFSDGRLLLRGANGAGKSKTLEMLLPYALDGDKARITASAKHHTSLLWLMTDGYDGQARVGYVWVEFVRMADGVVDEVYTCGVGIRSSASAHTATAWHFATTRRIGHDLFLEDDAGPLSRARLAEEIGDDGQVFEKAAAYKAHVGRTLFGLDVEQYDEVLRLLYWLRQPQIGEDIEPVKLTQQLSQALPQLDERAVRTAGDTFDELTAFGEQIERRSAAAQALGALAQAYRDYAGAAVAERARTVVSALQEERRLRAHAKRTDADATRIEADRGQAQAEGDSALAGVRDDDARLATLESSPEFRSQRRLDELDQQATRDGQVAQAATTHRERRERETRRRAGTRDTRRDQVVMRLQTYTSTLRDLDRRQRQTVPGSALTVPAFFEGLHLERVDQSAAISDALDHSQHGLQQARAATSTRTAAVALMRDAVRAVDRARSTQEAAQNQAERAEQRWERARDARMAAEQVVDREHAALADALRQWTAAPHACEVQQSEELTEDFVNALPRVAADAASAHLTHTRDRRAAAGARRDAARAEQSRLQQHRAEVAAQRDPSPPAPALDRTPRVDGAALWQVVDFVADADPGTRANVEAALQASGLLDAWVRPGGLLLDAHHHDVVLGAQQERDGCLLDLLSVDLPPDTDLRADDVRRVLAGIGHGDSEATAWIAPDGRWRLGPAHGRATKPTAQYIGATARAQERARRLALLDAALAEQQAAYHLAAAEFAELSELIARVEAWVADVPSGVALLKAWNTLDERLSTEARDEDENRHAQQAAHAARMATAAARADAEHMAAEQGLSTDANSLAALDQELRGLDEALREGLRADVPIRDHLGLWQEAVADWESSEAELREAQHDETVAVQTAGQSRAQADALRASLGDTIQQLQGRIAEVRASRAAHQRVATQAAQRAQDLTRASGKAQADADNARARLAEHLQGRTAALAGLVEVTTVPGMLEASGITDEDAAVIVGLAGLPESEPVARHVITTSDRLAASSTTDPGSLDTRVWRANNDASSGPGADHQTLVAKFGDLLSVVGRDDAGEATIVTLARRVQASVDGDRDLLTAREKQQFEQHILGELGDAIRACRRDAEELVAAMNAQLGKVTTTQGIRVDLKWNLRDDVPAEAAAAVRLLGQPVGALLPEEREALRDALHRLIEFARAEHPEGTYSEHLGAALDYRTWSHFTIRYSRPEKPGHWERLHKRSPLSQGEQKVLCYLPLFAAAAAHFTSLAGAAPYAPRLVLLDDAFPKIDVRTHPLLFGLLVQLDLDFVITSERLWGDHDTVPSLSIYEALRDPSERGIAQYHYQWDGRALHSLG